VAVGADDALPSAEALSAGVMLASGEALGTGEVVTNGEALGAAEADTFARSDDEEPAGLVEGKGVGLGELFEMSACRSQAAKPAINGTMRMAMNTLTGPSPSVLRTAQVGRW
jgi:hypothetical protein